MSEYPVIMNGDHAEFEAEWAASGHPEKERPDWPLPSFDARDWAEAFLDAYEKSSDADEFLSVDVVTAWFAMALMRGYDEYSGRLTTDAIAESVRLSKVNAIMLNGLRIIAGQEQCIDNLMSHVELARAAIAKAEGIV